MAVTPRERDHRGPAPTKCPRCGLVAPEIRCPRCNALKVSPCLGACGACGLSTCQSDEDGDD